MFVCVLLWFCGWCVGVCFFTCVCGCVCNPMRLLSISVVCEGLCLCLCILLVGVCGVFKTPYL